MKSKPYHHGDLRTVMIEKGIEFIDEHGAKGLSLRKIAAACGVSHAAPYSHFASKEELLSAIEKHISGKFADALKDSVKETGVTIEGLINLSHAYVKFFVRKPEYYRFIFSHSSGIEAGDGHEYEPYDFFKGFMRELLETTDYPKEIWAKIFYAQWSMMHGLASIGILMDDEEIHVIEKAARDILSNNYLIIK